METKIKGEEKLYKNLERKEKENVSKPK